jgi:hypothetical protein
VWEQRTSEKQGEAADKDSRGCDEGAGPDRGVHQPSPDRGSDEGDRTHENENLANTIAFESLTGWLKKECSIETCPQQDQPAEDER